MRREGLRADEEGTPHLLLERVSSLVRLVGRELHHRVVGVHLAHTREDGVEALGVQLGAQRDAQSQVHGRRDEHIEEREREADDSRPACTCSTRRAQLWKGRRCGSGGREADEADDGRSQRHAERDAEVQSTRDERKRGG